VNYAAAHSQDEELWFTLGLSSEGTLLAVAHTYQSTDAGLEQVRIISARTATRRERQQYENEPRYSMLRKDIELIEIAK
jgi:uncharacterized DUF497 family protein